MAAIEDYKLKNGQKRYMFKLYVGVDPLTGKEQRTTRRGFKTKKEAQLALSRLQLEIDYGTFRKTIDILDEWKKRQKQDYFKLGYNTLQPNQLIFNNKNNEYLQLAIPQKWMLQVQNKYELEKISPHGLRHTHCSLLFEVGASIKEVQVRLGHSNIQTTMNIYAHVTKKAENEAIQRYAQYLNITPF